MINPLGALPGRFRNLAWGTATLDRLPPWHVWPIRLVRYLHVTVRDLMEGELVTRAGSLAYTTLLSLVPLLAVSFSVLKGFGVHNQLEPALLQVLAPLGEKASEMTTTIVGFVDNMKVGALGAAGLAMLIYTVVSTMQKIESAFNYSWRVTAQRTLKQRFSDYMSVLVVGPMLIFAAVGITGAATNSSIIIGYLAAIQPFGTLLEWLSRLLPYLMIISAFTFIYVFMPNTRVRFGSALFGGVVGGVLWQTTGWVFAKFVAGSTQYAAVYSAFAGLIVFVIWIYLAWLILLIGANSAFYHQHPEHLCLYRREPRLSLREQEALALCVIKLIATRFYGGNSPLTLGEFSRELLLPETILLDILGALEQAGLLTRTAGREPAYLLSRPPDATSMQQVLAAVRNTRDDGLVSGKLANYADVDALMQASETATTDVLSARKIKELGTDQA